MTNEDAKYAEDFLIWVHLEAKLSGTYIYNEAEFKKYNRNIEIVTAGDIFLKKY